MDRIFFAVGALNGLLGVALGAFAAHGLEERLSPDMRQIFDTGARYHLIHALAILAVALAMPRWPRANLGVAAIAFTAGIVVFSGSLYALSLSGQRWLGAITPVGGAAFLFGWGWIAVRLLRT